MRKLKLEELGRVSLKEYKKLKKKEIIVILDNLRSGLNVGSIFRTCDGFAISKIFLCGITPTPPHKEIFKTAIGSEHSVEWIYKEKIEESIKDLKNQDYKIYGIEQTDQSISLQSIRNLDAQKSAIIFGNEVDGISDVALNLIDQSIEIDQFGIKHSLNVSVCAGITLWHFSQESS